MSEFKREVQVVCIGSISARVYFVLYLVVVYNGCYFRLFKSTFDGLRQAVVIAIIRSPCCTVL